MQESRPLTVVILEDDADVVHTLEVVLHDMGVRPLVCSLRHEVLPCIVETQPQLIILDVRMGPVDGIEIFHQLRAEPTTRNVPVIFFTATEQRVRSRIPNYNEQNAYFVGKPNVPRLTAKIEEILRDHA
jgi:DNA-binding response OmpR family regulator